MEGLDPPAQTVLAYLPKPNVEKEKTISIVILSDSALLRSGGQEFTVARIRHGPVRKCSAYRREGQDPPLQPYNDTERAKGSNDFHPDRARIVSRHCRRVKTLPYIFS